MNLVPADLLVPPDAYGRGFRHDDSALVLDGWLRRLAAQEARGRLVVGRLATTFLRRRGAQRHGFARLHDYARERLGLEIVLPPALRSNTITSLRLPPGLDYPRLHDGLKARGFVIYEGQGWFAREAFRVANMGALERADFERFVSALGEVLTR